MKYNFILKGWLIMSKVEKFISLVECIVVAFSNWSLTQNFKDKERLKIFFILTRRAIFSILIVALIGEFFIEPIAIAVFSVGNFPIFLQPLCLFIVNKNLNLHEFL